MNDEQEPNKSPQETIPPPSAEMEVADAVVFPSPETQLAPSVENIAPEEVAPADNIVPLPEPEPHVVSPLENIAVLPELTTPAPEHLAAGSVPEAVAETPLVPENKKKWYVVKVQSGREDSIKNNLERRIKIENLEAYIGRVLIPVEKVTEVRNGKRVEKKRKKFPGYLMCEVELNDDVKVLFRESSGVGEFVGGRIDKDPAPMSEREVERMLLDTEVAEVGGKKPKETKKEDKIVLNFAVGDRVKVLQGMFKDSEGEVKEIPEKPAENSKVKVVVQFWGRPVDVDVDYWHVERV